LLKLGDPGVDKETPSISIDSTSKPALGTNVNVGFEPLVTVTLDPAEDPL
jgi:hypothetical protein